MPSNKDSPTTKHSKFSNGVPKEIRAALTILKDADFESFLVGGCVRDLLLSRTPSDWDITTNARPEKIQELFPNSFYENKFGTVSVVTGSDDPRLRAIEITPFRIEGKYSDKRHPDDVKFADKLEDDLGRRDLTINAMAMDPDLKLIDHFGGQADLEKKIIRAVGNPEDRFEEDALRILRAVRLASELNFPAKGGPAAGWKIESETEKALQKKVNLLKLIAHERIRDEFSKMIMTEKPSNGINMLRELEILKIFLPELVEGWNVGQNKHHIYTVWEHNLNSLDHAAKEKWPLVVRISALFHDIGKPQAKRGEGPDSTFYGHEIIGAKIALKILSRLKYSTEFTEKVAKLVRYHLFYYNVDEVSESSVRRLIRQVGPEDMEDLIRVRICDRIGSGVPKAEPYKLRHFRFLVEKLQRDPISVKMLKIDGDKIKELANLPQSIKVGLILNALMDEVLESPEKNNKEYLEKRALELNELPEKELKKIAEAGKNKKFGLEEEEVAKIKKKHYVK